MKALKLLFFLIAVVVCALAISLQGGAQSYPNKPLQIVVSAAGGSADIMARIIGTKLSASLMQPVVVANRPGAGGMIAFDSVAKAPADGYTMVLGDIPAIMLNASMTHKQLNLMKDFMPVSLVSQVPIVLVIDASLPVRSVRELIDFAKTKPNLLVYGSTGYGSQGQLAGERFKTETRTSIKHIPYRGGNAIVTALSDGKVQMIFTSLTVAKELTRSGKTRILAITGNKRSKLDPELPTFAEAGLPGFDVASKFGMFLPPGVSHEIVARLNTEIVKIVNTSDVREQFAKIGAEPIGTTPEQLVAFIREENNRWAKVVHEVGATRAKPPVASAPGEKVTTAEKPKAMQVEAAPEPQVAAAALPPQPAPVASAPEGKVITAEPKAMQVEAAPEPQVAAATLPPQPAPVASAPEGKVITAEPKAMQVEAAPEPQVAAAALPPQPAPVASAPEGKVITAEPKAMQVEAAPEPQVAAATPPPQPAPVASAPEGKAMPVEPATGSGSSQPAVAGQKVQIEDAYWNSWFTRGGARVGTIEKGKKFTFILDLSQYQYATGQSAPVDSGTRNKLREAVDLKQKEIEFVIRPILVGGVLEFADEPASLRRMTVQLDRLLVKKPDAIENQLLREYRNGKLQLADFAEKTRAGTIAFNIVAKRDGCASIALSIWDETGQFPLDNLIHTVTVGAGPGDGTTCCKDGSELRGGLATLLSPSLDRGPGASDSIDAALHVFEFPHSTTEKRTVAILVDKSRYEAAPRGATVMERGVFAWELESTLSQYLVKPGKMLLLINKARDQASNGITNAYSVVADDFRLKIFSGVDDGQDKVAKLALTALQDMVRKAKRTPIIVVRMYSVDNEPIYLPLGLLSARAKEPVLSRPVTIIQPLQRERYVSSKACIAPWTFGIPQQLSEVGSVDMTDVLLGERAGGETHWLRTLADLSTWLSQSDAESISKKPEGFLLLAHHADGKLWFESDDNCIERENVKRKFSAGSVAVLSACSIGNPEGDNSVILNKLNQNGMDAMIVSPFPVRTDYGIRLARYIVSVIHDEHLLGHTPTLVQIFNMAADRTVEDLSKSMIQLNEMNLEFLILGDYNMQLCKP